MKCPECGAPAIPITHLNLEPGCKYDPNVATGAAGAPEPRPLGFAERVPTNPLAHRVTQDFLATRLREIAADNDDAATDLELHIAALEAELAEVRAGASGGQESRELIPVQYLAGLMEGAIWAERPDETSYCPRPELVEQWAAEIAPHIQSYVETALRSRAGEERPSGPWHAEYDEHGETRRGWRIFDTQGNEQIWLPVPGFNGPEAFAVRDALNRVAAGTEPK